MEIKLMSIEPIESNLGLKEYWYQHFQSYQKSGLSKSTYAKVQKISKGRFMYWSRKFELASCSSSENTNDSFVAVKIGSEPNNRMNCPPCSMWLGEYQLLIHDMNVLPIIMQITRSL
jgi:hypothetical protein